ncbi:MAG: SDR family NAD(P)-dependent oxidoreductase [Proteobacteria bacterium]|nr:SDR family NAD(P)-dependent oxidoreductase [Pseudomonadota bacterium]
MPSLKKFAADKIWVVTGAGGGIGLEMVRLIARQYGVVWAIDRDGQALEALTQESLREGWDIYTECLDVVDQLAVEHVVAKIVKTSKRIDVWINNAGVQRVGSFLGMSIHDFDLVVNVNFLSVVRITRTVLGLMQHQGSGHILNLGSVAGHVPSPFMSAYVAAKHAVVGFSKSLQAELVMMMSPVRVSFASPGFVNTPILDRGGAQGFPEWLSWMVSESSTCAAEILTKLAKGESEIYPTFSGRLMRKAYAVAPKSTVKSSKMLLTKGFGNFLLNRFQVPR